LLSRLLAATWLSRRGLKKMKSGKAALALLVLVSFLYVTIFSFGVPLRPCFAGGTLAVAEMAGKAVEFINGKYCAGEKIDGYTAYVLKLAGEDLAAAKWAGNPEWTSDSNTLKSKIEKLADLLGDNNSLVTFITGTQNADGSFGPYANEYGAKAPLQALAAVKADTVGTAVYDQVKSSIDRAVSYFKSGYQSGSTAYDVNGWNFDYRCVEALAAAGGDLSVSDWVYNGISLKDAVIASATAAAKDPTVKDAVYLAKELTALHAVSPASGHIDTLAGAIIAKQNTVDGQVYFGSSIYDDVLVLTALGKAGKLDRIDQAKALAYLNSFKHPHTNSWGSPAGAAWGGYYQEEPDLTAQALTALSYFTGAGDQDSDVYQSIRDGLTYLADIQDADTAAVPAQWDSTFATSETLIALKSLGKTYNDYAGAASTWMKKSKTKTIAQCLLALSQWEDGTDRLDRLANLLAGRQRAADPGKGSFENSVYSDMWAYIALGEAGKMSCIDTAAKAYILSKQGADGSWGETWGTGYYPDFMSTTQAIRALTYLPDAAGDKQVQTAINNGLAYLKGLQQADGGVYSTAMDDPVVDNAELIVTLKKLGKDPAGADWKNSAGLTPVDYLLNNTMNEDGSFGASKNVFGAAESLAAYLLVGGQGGPGGGQPAPGQDEYSVDIAVVGMNGELLYGPGSVAVSKTGRWGLTAMGALDATGLNYTDDNGFVKSIDGQANSGMNGWMYKVNGAVPMVSAKDKQVNKGDRIIWWYSRDMNSPGPEWDSLLKGSAPAGVAGIKTPEEFPPALRPSKEASEALAQIDRLLGVKQNTTELGPLVETAKTVAVVGGDKLPSRAGIVALKKELAQNAVDLSRKIEAAKGGTIADKLGEVGLAIPANTLKSDVSITVKKASVVSDTGITAGTGAPPVPADYRLASAVYNFGPDGTSFKEPATLTLRVAWPPLAKPENLALAWYDKAGGKWIALPAVVDAGKGLILARISHFSDFAVLVKDERKSFNDVNSTTTGWARDAVEILAGAGVIAGVDGKHYEPERAVTRAELTRIMVKALDLPAVDGGATFKDVPDNRWYSGCVAEAVRAGLVKGYEDGTFGPDRIITREELAAILARALELEEPSGAEITFTDAGEVSAWAKDSVAAAASAGLIKGYPDGAFKPQGAVTRAEIAAMVYRALFNF